MKLKDIIKKNVPHDKPIDFGDSDIIYMGHKLMDFLEVQRIYGKPKIIVPHQVTYAHKRIVFTKYYTQAKKDLVGYPLMKVMPRSKGKHGIIYDLTPMSKEVDRIIHLESSIRAMDYLLDLLAFITTGLHKPVIIFDNVSEELFDALYKYSRSHKELKLNVESILLRSTDGILSVTKEKDEKKGVVPFNLTNLVRYNVEEPESTFAEKIEKGFTTNDITDITKSISQSNDFIRDYKELVKTNPTLAKKAGPIFVAIKENLDNKTRKIHGVIDINMKELHRNSPIRVDKLVGLTKIHGFKRQESENEESLDRQMDFLFKSYEEDEDTNIVIKKLTITPFDDHRNRYKIYTLRIQHKDVGFTSPYNIVFKIPVAVNGKYLKLNGNNYIMANQLFAKPIFKREPNVVRINSNYGNLDCVIQNSTFVKNKFDMLDLSNKFANYMRIKKITKKEKMFKSASEKSDTADKYGFNPVVFSTYDFAYIEAKDDLFKIDLMSKRFLEYNGTYAEYGDDQIEYHAHGDVFKFPYKELPSFLLTHLDRIYKDISKKHLMSKGDRGRVPFISINVINVKIPVIMFFAMKNGFEQTLKDFGVKYVISDKKDKDAIYSSRIKFADETFKYISFFGDTLKEKLLINGLSVQKLGSFTFKSMDDTEMFDKWIGEKFGRSKPKALRIFISKFLDPVIKQHLKEMKLETNLHKLVADHIIDVLMNAPVDHSNDMANYRIRMSEIITQILYKQIQQSLTNFKNKKTFSDNKIEIDSKFIQTEMDSSGLLQQTKSLNPLEELNLSARITKGGVGNMKASNRMMSDRDINKSYFGVISPTNTNEYSGIGTNQTLSLGFQVKDDSGSIQVKEFSNKINPFNMLSVVEAISPFMDRNDTTRQIMGNQQTGQFVQLENPDTPLVQTGFEKYVPQLMSDRFVKKSPFDGTIDSIDENFITIISKDKKHKVQIDTMTLKSRTKRGIFIPLEYKILVKSGQKVEKDQMIAATSSLANGGISIGKNLVVAELSYMRNYEDGWVISHDVIEKYKTNQYKLVSIKVSSKVDITNLNLVIGKKTNPGEVLFSYKDLDSDFDEFEYQEVDDEGIVGLEARGNVKTYTSPGGTVKNVVVRIASKDKVDPKIAALHNRVTKDIKRKVMDCKKNNPAKSEMYMKCIGNLEGSEQLTFGKFKVAGKEFDGQAVIDVYIEVPNEIKHGSKFTLAGSGGKGTVQHIMKPGTEPMAQSSGLKVEFVATAISVLGRKNINLYLQGYLGKVVYFANMKLLDYAKNGDISKIKKLLIDMYTILDRTNDAIILSEIKEFIKAPDATLIKFITSHPNPLNNVAFPSYVPPFKNRLSIRDIQDFAKLVGVDLDEEVEIDIDGTRVITDRKVPVLILPVYYLEHFSDAASSARGSLSVKQNRRTGSGLSGSADGKGSNKVGFYDINGLLAKNAHEIVKELFHVKSDNWVAQDTLNKNIIRNRTDELPDMPDIDEGNSKAKKSLKMQWKSFGIEMR